MENHAQLPSVPLIIVIYAYPWKLLLHVSCVNKDISLTHTSNVFPIILHLILLNVMCTIASIVMQPTNVDHVLLDGTLPMACV